MFATYLWHVSPLTQMSKFSLTNDIFSVNLICCFDILLLFMDTEIFAAYAGSCLFQPWKCLKMLSFLFVRTWAMLCILYLLCGIPFLLTNHYSLWTLRSLQLMQVPACSGYLSHFKADNDGVKSKVSLLS